MATSRSEDREATAAEILQMIWRIRRGLDIRVGDLCPICVMAQADRPGRVVRVPGKHWGEV